MIDAACEEWTERDQVQRKGRTTSRASTAAAHVARPTSHVPRPVPSSPTVNVTCAEGPRLRLVPLAPSSRSGDEYFEAERLAKRFFTPASHLLAALSGAGAEKGAGSGPTTEITGIDRLLPAGEQLADSVVSRSSDELVVKKFTSSFCIGDLLRTGRPAPVVGPAGLGFYFPNTFDASDASSSPPVGRVSGAEERLLLLCDVSCGKMSMGKGAVSAEELLRVYRDCVGQRDDAQAMRHAALVLLAKGGYQSMSVAVDGSPHIVTFDHGRIKPLFIVRYRRRMSDGTASATNGGGGGGGGGGGEGSGSVEVVDSGASNKCVLPLAPVLRPTSQGTASAAGTADVSRRSAEISAKIRLSCKDLIEAVCVKREELLSSLTSRLNDDDADDLLGAADAALRTLGDLQTRVSSLKLQPQARPRTGLGGANNRRPPLAAVPTSLGARPSTSPGLLHPTGGVRLS